jgi:hypothetical protein
MGGMPTYYGDPRIGRGKNINIGWVSSTGRRDPTTGEINVRVL